MSTLSALKSTYASIAKQLNAPREHIRFAETPQHNGSPHVEFDGNNFAYVITERGEEYERKSTSNENEILYWLVKDLTRAMASHFELAHRDPTTDSRRLFFQKHLDLIRTIDHNWHTRLQAEYEIVLEQHRFRDTMDEQ